MSNSLELVRLDGGEIFESDIREDNLQNIYWRMQTGSLIALHDMEDSHLRNVALMLIGMGYRTYNVNDRLRLLWLTALRLEWERRMKVRT